jgi:hypothetical protein
MAAALLSPLPRYTGQDTQVQMWSNQLCAALERWAAQLHAPVGEAWIVNGTTAARDIDPAVVTTIAEVVSVVGTLVQDLARGSPLAVT